MRAGIAVLVEAGAGERAGFADEHYLAAGAELVTREQAWQRAELLVKEPTPAEYGFLRDDLTLFTYLHLAADRPLTEALLDADTLGIAYETVAGGSGLPLLAPMSEIAGRLAAHAAASQLMLHGGAVSTQAATLAIGMQAEVTVLDMSPTRVRQLDTLFGGRARVLQSDVATVEAELVQADVVIGAVLVPGRARARLRCSSTSRSTRAAPSRPRGPRPTSRRPSRSTASATTASPTCPAACRRPPPAP